MMQTDEIYIPTGKERRNQILVLVLGLLISAISITALSVVDTLSASKADDIEKIGEIHNQYIIFVSLFSLAIILFLIQVFLGPLKQFILSRFGKLKSIPTYMIVFGIVIIIGKAVFAYFFPNESEYQGSVFASFFSLIADFVLVYILLQNAVLHRSLKFNIFIVWIPDLIAFPFLIAMVLVVPDKPESFSIMQIFASFALSLLTYAWGAYVYKRYNTLLPVLIFMLVELLTLSLFV